MLSLGNIAPSDGALSLLRQAGVSQAWLLDRHARRDRGEIAPYCFGLSDEELADKFTSIYLLPTGDAIWITTLLAVPGHLIEDC